MNLLKRSIIGALILGLISPSAVTRSDDFDFYTEDLIEIRDEGVFDSSGRPLDLIAKELVNAPAASESAADETSAFDAYKASILSNWGSQKTFSESRLSGLKGNLKEELDRFSELDSQIREAEKELDPIRKEIEDLEGQVSVLNTQLTLNKEKITKIELLIAEKQLAVRKVMDSLALNRAQLDAQKQVVVDYIRLLYSEESSFLSLEDEASDTLKLLLSDGSFSETLMGRDFWRVMEATGRELFNKLYLQSRELNEKRDVIDVQQRQISSLYASLNEEKGFLQQGRYSKEQLLEMTRGEEARYQELLEESIRQQLESAIAIQNIQDSIAFIESKLKTLDKGLDNLEQLEAQEVPEVVSAVSETENTLQQLEAIPEPQEEPGDLYPFGWPVEPRAVTAYFQDTSYPKRWGIHNAVDIRAPMRTEIRAPANAYVFQTKDNGMGYSYIILAHKNSLMTVYGHVNEIVAKAGTVIKKGDLIGYTGGAPGTRGAGLQTTGPHLHFEVYYKGKPVDPLDFLPVYELPIEYIPERFLKNPASGR